jgi:hypothetical protein
MHRVYAEGLLNISATYASHGDGGCFARTTESATAPDIYVLWTRNARQTRFRIASPPRLKTRRLRRPRLTQSHKPQYYEMRSNHMVSAQVRALRDFETTSAVLGRGWCVQERILKPRVLHFSAKGIVWECCKGRATQFSKYSSNELIRDSKL